MESIHAYDCLINAGFPDLLVEYPGSYRQDPEVVYTWFTWNWARRKDLSLNLNRI